MAETCTIVNKTKAILVLNLPHGVVPEHASMSVVATLGYVASGADAGDRPLRAAKRPVSGSVTLLAKGQSGDRAEVARSAIFAPDVKAAWSAGRIEILEDPPAAETPPTPDAPAKARAKKE